VRAAVPPVVVAVVAALGWQLPSTRIRETDVDPTAGASFAETVSAGEQDLHPVRVDRAEALAIGADEVTGQAVRLSLKAPDGTEQGTDTFDLDPGPAVRVFQTDLAPGDYQLVIEGTSDDPTDYEVWVAAGPELSTTSEEARYDGELSGTVAGPFLLRGTGDSVEITAHALSDLLDTRLTVLPLSGSEEWDRLINDDVGSFCPASLADPFAVPESPIPGLNWTDSWVSVPTREGQVYQVYVQPAYFPGQSGPYSITMTTSTVQSLLRGQPLPSELPVLESASFRLPDEAGEVSVETTGGSTLELTVNPGRETQVIECISHNDLAGARLTLPRDRTGSWSSATSAPHRPASP
jgi:hypothetical protein